MVTMTPPSCLGESVLVSLPPPLAVFLKRPWPLGLWILVLPPLRLPSGFSRERSGHRAMGDRCVTTEEVEAQLLFLFLRYLQRAGTPCGWRLKTKKTNKKRLKKKIRCAQFPFSSELGWDFLTLVVSNQGRLGLLLGNVVALAQSWGASRSPGLLLGTRLTTSAGRAPGCARAAGRPGPEPLRPGVHSASCHQRARSPEGRQRVKGELVESANPTRMLTHPSAGGTLSGAPGEGRGGLEIGSGCRRGLHAGPGTH